jgi:hypothetical protein
MLLYDMEEKTMQRYSSHALINNFLFEIDVVIVYPRCGQRMWTEEQPEVSARRGRMRTMCSSDRYQTPGELQLFIPLGCRGTIKTV